MTDGPRHQQSVQIPAVDFKGVCKRYGAFAALDDVNLSIRKGEHIVVFGPSGSGKSTLIRCVNGLEDYQSGVITVGGVPVSHDLGTVPQIRRKVGMVFMEAGKVLHDETPDAIFSRQNEGRLGRFFQHISTSDLQA